MVSTEPGEVPAPPSASGVARVTLVLALEPPTQRRWTILLRPLLVIPLVIAFIAVAVAAGVMIILSWFAALFTGRVPDGLQNQLTGFYRFESRLLSYAYLLHDVWPGVHFQHRPGDPVDLEIDHVALRRSAVFFRIILAIPAQIVGYVLLAGVWPYLLAMWFVGLVQGRTPKSLHQTAALVLRYHLRLSAYFGLLTPTQPFEGFFGDGVVDATSPSASASVAEPVEHVTPLAPTPAPSSGSSWDLARGTLEAAAASPPSPGGPWIVMRPVKVLLVIAIIFGIASGAANGRWDPNHRFGFYFYFHWYSSTTSQSDRTIVTSVNNTVVSAVDAFDITVGKCTSLACVTTAAASAAGSVSGATATLKRSYVAESSVSVKYNTFLSVLNSEESILTAMSATATTVTQDKQLFAKLQVDLKAQYPAAIALVKSL
jgi:hypothetical protein